MAKRKARIDSVAEAVRVRAKATVEIEPPDNLPLDSGDLPFFHNVIAEFASSEWSALQLELAAMLARTMADLVREQKLLREEGGVAYSDKETPVANPRKSTVQMHASSILSSVDLCRFTRVQAGEALPSGAPQSRTSRATTPIGRFAGAAGLKVNGQEAKEANTRRARHRLH